MASEDAKAFAKVSEAYKLPKGTDDEKAARTAAIQNALKGATEVPLEVMKASSGLLASAEEMLTGANANVISDAGIAILHSECAVRSAHFNVIINLNYLKDSDFKSQASSEASSLLDGLEDKSKHLLAKVHEILNS